MTRGGGDLAADYIIVGAGSAGAALAARLSEDPAVSVLLLEAGAPDKALELHVPAAFSKLFRGPYDWSYDTVPQHELDDRTIYWPRGKTLGGSSSLNAMMWIRGFAADYDEWADAAGPAWSWDALVPYFRRVERTTDPVDDTQGADGPQSIEHQRDPRPQTRAFLEAARELGHEVTPPNLPKGQGFSQTMVTQRRGGRASTADAYLRPAKRRGNLRVVTGALVRKVTFERSGAAGEPTLAARDGRVRRDRRHPAPGHRAARGHPERRRRSTRRSCSCSAASGLRRTSPSTASRSWWTAPMSERTSRTTWSPDSRPPPRAGRCTPPRASASSRATSRDDAGC